MMSIKEIVEHVFARWATDVTPAWGEGLYTPADDQFAEMAEEAIKAGPSDAPRPSSPIDEDVAVFVANFKDPTWAMLAVARQVGIAVAYQDRGTFEAYLRRAMTEDEWSRLKPLLEDYDEWLDNSGADESINFWRDMVLAEAAIDQDA